MQQHFHRNEFTWLAYLLLGYYGFLLNVLGPITPFLKDELKLSYTVSSLHFTAFASGILLFGLVGHILIQRVGRWNSLWMGAFGMSLGVFILLIGRNAIITIGSSFFMGFIGSALLTILSAVLAEQYGELRTAVLAEAWLVSSLINISAPLLVSWSAKLWGGWRLGLGIVALVPFLLRILFRKVSLFWTESSQEESVPTVSRLPTLFWIYWLALVLAVAIEFCMLSWSADFMENVLSLSKVDAVASVSYFLFGMITGRFLGARMAQTVTASGLAITSILVASIGFLVFWKAISFLMGVCGLFLTGLGTASLYPISLSMAMATVKNNDVKAGAGVTLATGVAILALPLSIGRLADLFGIRQAYGVVIVLLIIILFITQNAEWISKRSKNIENNIRI